MRIFQNDGGSTTNPKIELVASTGTGFYQGGIDIGGAYAPRVPNARIFASGQQDYLDRGKWQSNKNGFQFRTFIGDNGTPIDDDFNNYYIQGLVNTTNSSANARFAVRTEGIIYATNTTVQPIVSERRLKENIVAIDADTAWETVKSTPYYTYNFIGNETTSYGPMADEVPTDMVVQPMVKDKDGNKVARSDEEGPIRTYDNGMLQARLYTALQSALVRIEELEARLNAAGA